ncbi:hypothetical protein [Parvularcula sp. LCG005]|uniref:hypothetical protein n=1 Tax=Parvularcula sp. LCG005 TaxID=3078805 RepID=UPI002941C4F7|nr:hypothetical protein [Parvularcula sp. LCG005]WOI54616.1 hypothetical protein RUI03_06355 [Parvularcula sp. LCG005]
MKSLIRILWRWILPFWGAFVAIWAVFVPHDLEELWYTVTSPFYPHATETELQIESYVRFRSPDNANDAILAFLAWGNFSRLVFNVIPADEPTKSELVTAGQAFQIDLRDTSINDVTEVIQGGYIELEWLSSSLLEISYCAALVRAQSNSLSETVDLNLVKRTDCDVVNPSPYSWFRADSGNVELNWDRSRDPEEK